MGRQEVRRIAVSPELSRQFATMSFLSDKKRNNAIELYRILMIMGICQLHAIGQCGHNKAWPMYLLMPCVNGFAFISGWFGVSFSFRKLRQLLTVSVVAGGLALVSACFAGVFHPRCDLQTLILVRDIALGQWYLCAYGLLLLISPVLNLAIEKACSDKRFFNTLLVPFLVVVAWNWAPSWPILNKFVPMTPGLGKFTCCSLVVTYGVARVIRLKAISIKTNVLLVSSLASLVLIATGNWAASYASPFAVILAGSLFLLVERKEALFSGSKLIPLVAPSCFSIYLFHSHNFGYMFIKWFEDSLLAGFPRGGGVYHYWLCGLCDFAFGRCSPSVGYVAPENASKGEMI